MESLGLEADVVAFAGGTGVPLQKPDPCGLKYLMEMTNTPPDETILIGDRDERDGEAGRRAGVDVLIRTSCPEGPNAFQSFTSFIKPAADLT